MTYKVTDAKGLEQAFHEAEDDYLALCAVEGRKPDVPPKGSFNVRPGRDLHRRAMIVARRKGFNLSAVLSEALQRYLDREDQTA